MKKIIFNTALLTILAALAGLSGPVYAEQAETTMDIHNGYFSREGNNGSPSEASRNNIYIKLYADKWVALLYVPFPYAKAVTPEMINGVFTEAKRGITTPSYNRNTFGILQEAATIHMEQYEEVEGQTQFKCGSVNPCALRFGEDFVELVKSGIINEHLVKFNHIVE